MRSLNDPVQLHFYTTSLLLSLFFFGGLVLMTCTLTCTPRMSTQTNATVKGWFIHTFTLNNISFARSPDDDDQLLCTASRQGKMPKLCAGTQVKYFSYLHFLQCYQSVIRQAYCFVHHAELPPANTLVYLEIGNAVSPVRGSRRNNNQSQRQSSQVSLNETGREEKGKCSSLRVYLLERTGDANHIL